MALVPWTVIHFGCGGTGGLWVRSRMGWGFTRPGNGVGVSLDWGMGGTGGLWVRSEMGLGSR